MVFTQMAVRASSCSQSSRVRARSKRGGWYSHRWQSEQVIVAKALEYERAVNGRDGIHTDGSQSK